MEKDEGGTRTSLSGRGISFCSRKVSQLPRVLIVNHPYTRACGNRTFVPYTMPFRMPFTSARMSWYFGSKTIFSSACYRESQAIVQEYTEGRICTSSTCNLSISPDLCVCRRVPTQSYRYRLPRLIHASQLHNRRSAVRRSTARVARK